MLTSLASVCLSSVLFISINGVYAFETNGTTTAGSGFATPEIPSIVSTESSLDVPTAALTTAATSQTDVVTTSPTSYASTSSLDLGRPGPEPIIPSSDTSLAVPSTSTSVSVPPSTTEISTTPVVYTTPSTTLPETTAAETTSYSETPTTTSLPQAATTVSIGSASPIIQSTDTSLSIPITTSQGGLQVTPEAPTVETTETALSTPTTDESTISVSNAPAIETSETALSTPATDDSTSAFSYAPATTTTEEATSAQFTYAPETSTASSSDLLLGYIGSVAQSAASTSDSGALATAASSPTETEVAASPAPTETNVAASSTPVTQEYEYSPSTASQETSAIPATIVSVGSSAVPIAPVPQSSLEGASSSAPDAYVIGSQTASVGQTITLDSTPVVVQTSAGVTQIYAGTETSPSIISFASATAAPIASTAPAAVTIGSSAIPIAPVPLSDASGDSTAAPSAYVVGSQTASVGQTLTIDNTPVVIQTSAGETQLYAGTAATPSALSFATVAPVSTAPATVSIGSLALSIAPIPQSYAFGDTSAAAFLIGSQTATVGQTLTIDNTPVVIQTSAGETQLYAGTATPSALSFATTAAPSLMTGVPTTLTIGLQTVSQNSAGNYMLGSLTLVPGSSITQGSGSETAVIGVQTTGGSTQLVVEDASTTATTVLPKITSSASTFAEQESSAIVVNGHTYFLGPASLNAQATGTPTGGISSFITSGIGGASSATGAGAPSLQNGAASLSSSKMLFGGVALVALGFAVLL